MLANAIKSAVLFGDSVDDIVIVAVGAVLVSLCMC